MCARAGSDATLGRKEEKFEHLERRAERYWRKRDGKKERWNGRERERLYKRLASACGLPPLLSLTIKAGRIPVARAAAPCVAIVVINVVSARV